jgi:membrane fusion protein (multidrug efflux system)
VSDGSQGPAITTAAGTARQTGLNRNRLALIIGGPAAIAIGVGGYLLFSGHTESTDNAYIQMAKAPVSASVGGRVVEVLVKENQHVEAGQPLFRIDGQDYEVAVDQAKAQLAQAELQVRALKASYQQALASVTAARQTFDYATRENTRQRELLAAGVISQQDADQAQHTLDDARARLASAQAEAAAALANLNGDANAAIDDQPSVLAARARLRQAEISQGYTEIVAPVAGTVTRVDQLQVGGRVNPSQTVFWLLSGQPWIEANFKEDQLRKMKVGQPVEIKIDALDGKPLEGHVASFSPGTGSIFSALPAQNATGNWVKVTQRLPVQIAFDQAPPEMGGRAGLSAHVKVDVKDETPKGAETASAK